MGNPSELPDDVIHLFAERLHSVELFVMGNPSQLPDDVIHLFAERLHSVEDFVRFGVVCKSWQSIVEIRKKLHQQQKKIPFFSPWLMLSTYSDDNDNQVQQQSIQPFFCLSSETHFNLQLPQTQSRRCWGSPFGWLVTYGSDLNINLVNPLSRVQLSLPSQTSFKYQYPIFIEPNELREIFVIKFVLSSGPFSHPPCVVVAIYSEFRELAFARPGDEAWTPVESPYHPCYRDAIYFNDKFYAVTDLGELLVCEINTDPPTATDLACPRDGSDDVNIFYLVEMSGNLYMVERTFFWKGEGEYSLESHNRTQVLEVYKFNFSTKAWTKVCDLGDYAFFIGNGTSFSISTSYYPQLRPNCIYFVDDHNEYDCNHSADMGVYDMKEGSVEPIYLGTGVLPTLYSPSFLLPSF